MPNSSARKTRPRAEIITGLLPTLSVSLYSQGQQGTWGRTFKKPTSPNFQAVVPGGKTRSVKGKACLACEWSTKGLTSGQHCRAFSAQANRFSHLLEVFCLQWLAVD